MAYLNKVHESESCSTTLPSVEGIDVQLLCFIVIFIHRFFTECLVTRVDLQRQNT